MTAGRPGSAADGGITALICTANRPESIAQAVASVLANDHAQFELIVVDQSDDEGTAVSLSRFNEDARFRFMRSAVKGKSAALNRGLTESKTEIIACTDDDCVVPTDWLRQMAVAFDGRPDVAAVFGRVDQGPHDPASGFIPAYRPRGNRLLTSIYRKPAMRGMGACMGIRRTAVLALGGFDARFGPGADFPSADDWEIAFRALLAGFALYETEQVTVVHHGFRTYREGRALARRDWYAIGAMYATLIRSGHRSIIVVAVIEFARFAIWPPLGQLLRLRRPVGFRRALAFIEGFTLGLRRQRARAPSPTAASEVSSGL